MNRREFIATVPALLAVGHSMAFAAHRDQIEIQVMYMDFSIVRAPFNQARTLHNNGVEFITLSQRVPGQPRSRADLLRRIWGKDYYGLWFNQTHWLLEGWDAEDLYWRMRAFTNPPHTGFEKKAKIGYHFPPGGELIVFGTDGATLSPKDWEKALEIFNREMY